MKFQYRKMVQEIADEALDNVTINNIPFREWIDNVNNAYTNKKCNLTSCRYNTDGKCTNDEKRKECVEVAEKVLCVDKEKFMDEIREADEKQAGRCCVRMEMIIDFIKSWFYYPKMKKYLKDRCCIYYSQSRLNYALWHCKFSKKIEKAKQNIDNNDISEWTCQYQQEPIIRK